jgi:tetratricopeptide (TPR) repeat protein
MWGRKSDNPDLVEASKDAIALLRSYEERTRDQEELNVAAVFAHLASVDVIFADETNGSTIIKTLGFPRSVLKRLKDVTMVLLPVLIKDIRMDVAKKLVLEMGYEDWKAAECVGVSTRTFKESLKELLEGSTTGQRYAEALVDIESPVLWHRLVLGCLTEAEEAVIRAWLPANRPMILTEIEPVKVEIESYLAPREGEEARFLLVEVEGAARRYVEQQIWPLLRDQPLDFQKRIVARYRFDSMALYDFLHEKAREKGRLDRLVGIDLQELAVFSLAVSEDYLGEAVHAKRVSALAWLGNANALKLKCKDADDAFRRCDRILTAHPELSGSASAATVSALKGRLRMYESRHDEAADLLKQGLLIAEACFDHRLEAMILTTMGSNYRYAGRPEEAIAAYDRAITLLSESEQPELYFFARMNRVTGLCKCGRHSEAKEALSRVSDIPLCPGDDYLARWIKGFVEAGLGNQEAAEAGYLEAREGFNSLGDSISSACVDLDYAILLVQRGNFKGLELASRLLPTLEACRLLPQTMECLTLLRETLQQAGAEEAILNRLLTCLWHDPLLGLRMKKEPSSYA